MKPYTKRLAEVWAECCKDPRFVRAVKRDTERVRALRGAK